MFTIPLGVLAFLLLNQRIKRDDAVDNLAGELAAPTAFNYVSVGALGFCFAILVAMLLGQFMPMQTTTTLAKLAPNPDGAFVSSCPTGEYSKLYVYRHFDQTVHFRNSQNVPVKVVVDPGLTGGSLAVTSNVPNWNSWLGYFALAPADATISYEFKVPRVSESTFPCQPL